MYETYKKLWAILSLRERRQISILLVLMLGLGAFEMAGVASIFPLIAVLSSPEIIDNKYFNVSIKR